MVLMIDPPWKSGRERTNEEPLKSKIEVLPPIPRDSLLYLLGYEREYKKARLSTDEQRLIKNIMWELPSAVPGTELKYDRGWFYGGKDEGHEWEAFDNLGPAED